MGHHTAKIPQLPTAAQSYQLQIRLSKPISCQVGRLGRFDFPAGHYIYTGSARRNMAARLTRHLQQEKSLRWHIDYLLASRYAHVVEVRVYVDEECLLNQSSEGKIVAKGFGASDCQQGCNSHLKYLGRL